MKVLVRVQVVKYEFHPTEATHITKHTVRKIPRARASWWYPTCDFCGQTIFPDSVEVIAFNAKTMISHTYHETCFEEAKIPDDQENQSPST